MRRVGRICVHADGKHAAGDRRFKSNNLTAPQVSNGAALPPQTEIQQCGDPNTRGSLIVDAARSTRLLGSTAAAFLATPKAHDIVLEDLGFKYLRLKEALHKMKGRFPNRFASVGVRRAHHKAVFKKVASK